MAADALAAAGDRPPFTYIVLPQKASLTWFRRAFLATTAGAGASLLLGSLGAWASGEPDLRVAAIVADTIGLDTHNHVEVPLTTAEVPGPPLNLAGELKRSGLTAICLTFAIDYQILRTPGEGYERFLNGLTSLDQQLKRNHLTRALNLADLRAAHQRHQPTVIQSVEGSHFLDGKLERLGEAYGRGLRHLGLLHDHDASGPLGDVFTIPPSGVGSSASGRRSSANATNWIFSLTWRTPMPKRWPPPSRWQPSPFSSRTPASTPSWGKT